MEVNVSRGTQSLIDFYHLNWGEILWHVRGAGGGARAFSFLQGPATSRPLRLDLPNCFYHVLNRGVDRRHVLEDQAGREKFLELLGRVLSGCANGPSFGADTWCGVSGAERGTQSQTEGPDDRSSGKRILLKDPCFHENKRHGYPDLSLSRIQNRVFAHP